MTALELYLLINWSSTGQPSKVQPGLLLSQNHWHQEQSSISSQENGGLTARIQSIILQEYPQHASSAKVTFFVYSTI